MNPLELESIEMAHVMWIFVSSNSFELCLMTTERKNLIKLLLFRNYIPEIFRPNSGFVNVRCVPKKDPMGGSIASWLPVGTLEFAWL